MMRVMPSNNPMPQRAKVSESQFGQFAQQGSHPKAQGALRGPPGSQPKPSQYIPTFTHGTKRR